MLVSSEILFKFVEQPIITKKTDYVFLGLEPGG